MSDSGEMRAPKLSRLDPSNFMDEDDREHELTRTVQEGMFTRLGIKSKNALTDEKELMKYVNKTNDIKPLTGGFDGVMLVNGKFVPFMFDVFSKPLKKVTLTNTFYAAMKHIVQASMKLGVFDGTPLKDDAAEPLSDKHIMRVCSLLYNLMLIKRDDEKFMTLWKDDPVRAHGADEVHGWKQIMRKYKKDLKLVIESYNRARDARKARASSKAA